MAGDSLSDVVIVDVASVGIQGPPGPLGSVGPQGPQGPPGGAAGFPPIPVSASVYGMQGTTTTWQAALPLTGGTVAPGALILNASAAPASSGVVGLNSTATNTGTNMVTGTKFTYFSGAGSSAFDVGWSCLGIFDTNFIAGQTPFTSTAWIVAQSPNDTTHNWSCMGGEVNVVNRGNDVGWKRDRTTANPTGGWLVVPEIFSFAGSGGGEGKNASFAYSIAHSGGNNSTGFPAKFYNGYLVEPNAIVGLTGRGIYATGDITGTSSQYPYGPMQLDGTWLHGIDHTLATYIDGMAQVLATGQRVGWITGTTASPTGEAFLSGSGSGANVSLTMTPSGTGNVTVAGPLSASGAATFNGGAATTTLAVTTTISGAGFSTYLASPPAIGGTAPAAGTFTQINANVQAIVGAPAATAPNLFIQGATGTNRLIQFYTAATVRWQFGVDNVAEGGSNAGSDLILTGFSDAGAPLINPLMLITRSTGQMTYGGPARFNGTIGFNNTPPVAQPAGWGTSTGGVRAPITASSTLAQVAAGLAQLLTDLKAYGLLGT